MALTPTIGMESRINGLTNMISEQISDPYTPHMSSYENRLNSFSNWRINIQATPQQLATAGLFYTGKRDCVKCFHCNGTLQNFEYNDEPWVEHGKWFPSCEFLHRQKGSAFVDNITKQFPQINRPVLTKRPTSNNCNVDYKEYESALATRTDTAMKSVIVEEALKFGYEEAMVRTLVKLKLQQESCEYKLVEGLISDLQKAENGSNNLYAKCRTPELHQATNHINTTENNKIPAGLLMMSFSTNAAS